MSEEVEPLPNEDPDAERKLNFPTILGQLLHYERGSGFSARLKVRQIDGSIVDFRQGYITDDRIKKFRGKTVCFQLVRRVNDEKKTDEYYGRAIIPVHPHDYALLKVEIEPLLFNQKPED